jgi:hypothetical protein
MLIGDVRTPAVKAAIATGPINPRKLVIVDADAPARFVTLAGRRVDPLTSKDAAGRAVNMAAATAAVADDLRLVQFEQPLTTKQVAWLNEQGVTTIGFLPDNTYIVRATSGTAAQMRGLDGVRWVGNYAPEYRYGRRLQRVLSGRAGRQASISVNVFFMAGVAAEAAAAAVGTLGTVESVDTDAGEVVVAATLETRRLGEAAALPGVVVIEHRPQAELHNNVAADVVDARDMWLTRGFYGSNEIVAVADSGLDIGVTNSAVHRDFQDGAGRSRVLAIADFLGDGGSDPYSGHGTHVAGSVLGNGHLAGANPTNNTFPSGAYAGMAPKAWLYFQALGSNNPAVASRVYPPADLNALFQPAYTAGARIHQNSWGTDAYGDYNADMNARNADLFCFNHPEMLILYSAGNAGEDTVAPLGVVDPGSIGTPSLAKNVLSVGATENNRPLETLTWGSAWSNDFPNEPIKSDRLANNTNGMAGFSSRGPSSDGRIKPEMVAPGTYIASPKTHAAAAAVLWGDAPGNTNYAYSGGTSMASPLVAGAAATFREYLRVERGFKNPPAALVKAGLLCGAVDIAPGQYGTGPTQEVFAAPNSVEGWGRLSLENAFYRGANYRMNFWTNAFGGPGTYTISVTNFDPSYPFKAILCWTDMCGSYFGLDSSYSWMSGGGLVNDLELRVIDPLGRTNYPRAQNTRLDLFYYTNIAANAYVSPLGMFEAERCTAPGSPLTLSRIFQVLYDTTGAGGTYGTFIWRQGPGGAPGATIMAYTGTVAAGSAGFKPRLLSFTPITLTDTHFFVGSQLLSANILQLRDNIPAGSPRTYSTHSGPWTYDNNPDMWIHACGTVATGDHINTVEGIVIDNPTGGVHKIVVSGNNVPYTPVRFGVAYSGGLVPEPLLGTVLLLPLLLRRARSA